MPISEEHDEVTPTDPAGAMRPGSSLPPPSWPSVIQSGFLALSNLGSAAIAYLLVSPVARSIPEHLAAGRWREAGIAGAIVAVVAAPLGLKYAGRLVTAVKGLRGSK